MSASIDFEVILVDDDEVFIFLMKALLSRNQLLAKHRVMMNGQELIDYIDKHDREDKTFLLFLDINMPLCNGWAFLDHLNQGDYKATYRVVIVTSSVHPLDKKRAEMYPQVLDLLIKPVSFTKIADIIHRPELAQFMG